MSVFDTCKINGLNSRLKWSIHAYGAVVWYAALDEGLDMEQAKLVKILLHDKIKYV